MLGFAVQWIQNFLLSLLSHEISDAYKLNKAEMENGCCTAERLVCMSNLHLLWDLFSDQSPGRCELRLREFSRRRVFSKRRWVEEKSQSYNFSKCVRAIALSQQLSNEWVSRPGEDRELFPSVGGHSYQVDCQHQKAGERCAGGGVGSACGSRRERSRGKHAH